MDDEGRTLERIERAQREIPFCTCGLPTLIVAARGGLWLECASLSRPPAGPLRGYVARVTAPLHKRQLIVEDAELAA